jgi:hypothetical protein
MDSGATVARDRARDYISVILKDIPMAVQLSDADVPNEAFGKNASRKRLITLERVKDTRVLLLPRTLGKTSRP